MDRTIPSRFILAALLALLSTRAYGDDAAVEWGRFRGPNGSGVSSEGRPPASPDPNQPAWKTAVPPGVSSPVLSKHLVVLTGVRNDRLVTVAYDRASGKQEWVREAPPTPIEKVHETGSPAASTPCIDGDRVYVYFGSFGLLCYGLDGEEVWRKPIPTPKSLYGMSCSPIVHGDRLFMVLDDDANLPDSRVSRSRIIAIDKATGKEAWQAHRPFHRSGWSTPTVWEHADGTELVVLGNGQLRGYDIATGAEKWHVKGFSRETIGVPVVGDGVVYASASMIGGVSDERPDPRPFWEAMLKFDANDDGKLERAEMTEHFTFPFRPDLPPGHPGFGMPMPRNRNQRQRRLDGMFNQIDRNKDGFWTSEEFVGSLSFRRGKPRLVAVRPGGQGDVTDSHVAWSLHRSIPEIPSPILYKGRLYLVRDGGLLSVVNASDGSFVYRERVGAGGHYRASPVIANGLLYMASEPGVVSVVRTGDAFELVHRFDLQQQVAATAAIGGPTIYIRTESHLWAFGRD